MTSSSEKKIITGVELGNYVVCPEAWRLKYLTHARQEPTAAPQSSDPGVNIRKKWVQEQELTAQLKHYAQIIYFLLVLLVIVVFLWDQRRVLHRRFVRNVLQQETQQITAFETEEKADTESLALESYAEGDEGAQMLEGEHGEGESNSQEPSQKPRLRIPSEIWFLLLVLGAIIFLWDLFDRLSRKIRKTSGLHQDAKMLALKASKEIPSKEYYSTELGLASKPDALVQIDDHIVPVLRKPLTKKVHDRHIIELLANMRLVDEFEGNSPPFGILLLGKKVRTVRIKNSPDRQRWLDTVIDEIRYISDGGIAQPTPSPGKCKHCDVLKFCEHSAYAPSEG